MAIQVKCVCGTVVAAPPEAAGGQVVCPRCRRELTVPGERTKAAPTTVTPSDVPVAKVAAGAPKRRPRPAGSPEPVRDHCPFCKGPIRPDARKCPHCQEYLDPELAREARRGTKVSTLAVSSFVIALTSPVFLFTTAPLAFLLGFFGLFATRKGKAMGRGMAVWGLLLSLLWLGVLGAIGACLARHGMKTPDPLEPLF